MKKLLIAFTLIAALMTGFDAAAFETPVDSEKGKQILNKMGEDLRPEAAKFGCDVFAWASFVDKGRVAAFQYIPKGQTRENWSRAVSITVYTLPGEPAKDVGALYMIVEKLRAGYEKNAKVISKQMKVNAAKEPGMFIEYTIGNEQGGKEHNAGIFLRLSKTTAGFLQIQSRGKPLPKEDVERLKAVMSGKANVPKSAAAAPKAAASKAAAPAQKAPADAKVKF